MTEEYEKQYAVSAEVQGLGHNREVSQGKSSAKKPATDVLPKEPVKPPDASKPATGVSVRQRMCYQCRGYGHLRRDCPQNAEAPGRSKASTSTAAVGASSKQDGTRQANAQLEELSESQLESLRVKRPNSLRTLQTPV